MKKKPAKKAAKRTTTAKTEGRDFMDSLCSLLMNADIGFVEHWDDGCMVKISNLSTIELREVSMQLQFLANIGEHNYQQKTKGE